MFSGLWDSNNLNNDNKRQNISKELLKVHDGKNMKTIPLTLETMK